METMHTGRRKCLVNIILWHGLMLLWFTNFMNLTEDVKG